MSEVQIQRDFDTAVEVTSYDMHGDHVEVSFGAGTGRATLSGPRTEMAAALARALDEVRVRTLPHLISTTDQQVVIHPIPNADRYCDYCDATVAFEVSVTGITQGQACRAHVGDLAGNLAKGRHT